MPYVFELYYPGQKDVDREARLITDAMTAGGRLGGRVPSGMDDFSVCLTFEFDDCAKAEFVADALRQRGENVVGVFEYPSEN